MARDEQVMPTMNQATSCQDTLGSHIQADLDESKRRGIETYGTALQPCNGRDVSQDAFEEWIDLGLYIEQWKRERRLLLKFLKDICTLDIEGANLRNVANELLHSMGEEV